MNIAFFLLQALRVNSICALMNMAFLFFQALRVNGIWALMNMAFQAEQKVKLTILSSLGTEQLFHLLSDENPDVVIKTLGMLRNLLTGKSGTMSR